MLNYQCNHSLNLLDEYAQISPAFLLTSLSVQAQRKVVKILTVHMEIVYVAEDLVLQVSSFELRAMLLLIFHPWLTLRCEP